MYSSNQDEFIDDTSEYIIKVEVANETVMSDREGEVTQEHVSVNTVWPAPSHEDYQEDHEYETTHLHLQSMSVSQQETPHDSTIGKEIHPEEGDTSSISPTVMTTGMRVLQCISRFRDELARGDLCENNVPQYTFSELVDEVLDDNEEDECASDENDCPVVDSNECLSEDRDNRKSSRRLDFSSLIDSSEDNKMVSVQCQLKGVPRIKDLKKLKKNRRGRGKGV